MYTCAYYTNAGEAEEDKGQVWRPGRTGEEDEDGDFGSELHKLLVLYYYTLHAVYLYSAIDISVVLYCVM